MKQFQWCDADTKNPIESFYIFPDESKFEKVKQSKDRVYLLEMMATQQRYFYWMQHDESENDADLCKKVHNTLNNISEPTIPSKTAPTPGGASAAPAGASGA